jgi:hypothetical protein
MGMVNFHDPAVIEKDFCAYACDFQPYSAAQKTHEILLLTAVLIKLWHILIGLYV